MTGAERYLRLLKKSLLNELYLENEARVLYLFNQLIGQRQDYEVVLRDFVGIAGTDLYRSLAKGRETGGWIQFTGTDQRGQVVEKTGARNFVFLAHTMIGRKRLDQLHACLDQVVQDKVPGDLIETGVWRGGATVFMRGYLQAHGIRSRKVWVADSFEGLPTPSHEVDVSHGNDFSGQNFPYLSVSQAQVQDLFERYDLLDDQVRFLTGWFRDSLPEAPVRRLAVLRLDGDLYESTWDALTHLYHKVSPGGYVIVDDYRALAACGRAVDDFRRGGGIHEPLIDIDQDAVYWRKTS